MFDLNTLLTTFAGFIGIASFLSVVINVGKRLEWIKDGDAGKASAIGNLVFFVAFVLAKLFVPQFDFIGFDGVLEGLASIGIGVLAFITQLKTSNFTYNALKEYNHNPIVSLLSYSYGD